MERLTTPMAVSKPALEPKPTKYRIAFTTPRVQPSGMPSFPYRASQINFDSIEFIALVEVPFGHEQAIAEVVTFWPEATATQVEEADTLPAITAAILSHVMGVLPPPPPAPPKPSRWARLRHYFTGTGPF